MQVRTPAFVAASLVVVAMFLGPIGLWPWDHDEVQSLMETGAVPMQRYPGPPAQMERMPRLIPLWRAAQSSALTVFPANEWGTRVLPATCGALVVIIAFAAAARSRSSWFAWSLLIMMAASQTLVWLSQQNRFYSLALLWTTLCCVCVWSTEEGVLFDVLAGVFSAAAVLSHNLTLVLFGLGAASSIAAWTIGAMPARSARRALIAAVVPVLIYGIYLRPLLAGWMSGGTGGTNPLVSYVAQTGIAPLALAFVGSVLALRSPAHQWLRWWALLLLLSIGFVGAAPTVMGNWNPRYALFFMPPAWVLAAAASAAIAEALAVQKLATVWLMAVFMLLAPKLVSHYIDGSRHDFRAAARLVSDKAPSVEVFSNWPADLQYYLEPLTGQKAQYWNAQAPETVFIVVTGSNAWEPILRVGGRRVTTIGEISRRRFDEQSHVVRVYLVEPK